MHMRFWPSALALAVSLAVLPALADVTSQEAAIALTLATGAGIEPLQRQVTSIENKAIANGQFSEYEKVFLRDLYGAMAAGAKTSVVLGQSGRLMDRYLDKTGEPLELDARIFSGNARVRREIERLPRDPGRVHRSPRFYMPNASSLDSITGLYWGTVEGTVRANADGQTVFHVRAEVPWQWPSYESLQTRYGTPHAETFVLPNLRSAVSGDRYGLHIENGLGEYLVRLGLAKPFLAWAEWDEPLPVR